MTEEVKASDILLELQKDIQDILAYVKNIDFKYSVVLDKLSRLEASSVAAPPSPASFVAPKRPSQPVVQQPLTPQIQKSESNFSTPPGLKEKLQAALARAADERKELAPKEVEKPIQQATPNTSKQVPVQERITYADGKPVYLAQVDIFDQKGNSIKQLKTNQSGKWMTPLPPGDYKVRVTKAKNSVRMEVDNTYYILVPDNDKVFDMGNRTVEI